MSSALKAVFNTNGQQFRAKEGDTILTNRIKQEVGSTVTIDDVILLEGDDGSIKIGDAVKNTTLTATVAEHLLDKKLRIFKMRRRKSSRRTQGHRQMLTRLRIDKIAAG